MKIYTKTGDQGETSLFNGRRVSKAALLVESYGRLDELNAQVGKLVCALVKESKGFLKEEALLKDVQSQIFCMGAYLASNFEKEDYTEGSNSWVLELENFMDKADGLLPDLKNFILPGGATSACEAHICRVSARSAERFVVKLQEEMSEDVNIKEKTQGVIIYLNRLSDFFFVLSRWVNFQLDIEEPIWKI